MSDADNIDRFGAYRLLEWGRPLLDDYATLISKACERSTVLQNYRVKQIMETAAGNRWFNQQLDFQINFFERLIVQAEMGKLVSRN